MGAEVYQMTENTDWTTTDATPQETTLAQEQPPNLFYPIFIGLALSTVTLNFLNLQYILPAIGLLFLWLGFRRLRQVNGWFSLPYCEQLPFYSF